MLQMRTKKCDGGTTNEQEYRRDISSLHCLIRILTAARRIAELAFLQQVYFWISKARAVLKTHRTS
jgi:hypothetical protein